MFYIKQAVLPIACFLFKFVANEVIIYGEKKKSGGK